MKKFLAILLATLVLMGAVALAEETQPLQSGEDLYTRLVVGSTTPLSGSFFTEMWGNNTSDIDVRMLLHGYNLMEWHSAVGSYGVNEAVVSGLAVTDDQLGNRTYTVSLYNDLEYSDGTPITARDYVFAVLLSLSPQVAQIGGQTVNSDYIVGAAAYRQGLTDILTGVSVLTDTMFSITVGAEYRPFFYELALLDYCPYPISVIAPGCTVVDTGDGVAIRNEDATETERIFTAELLRETILDPQTGYLSHPTVVSGPYTLTSFDWDTRVATFAINTHYKGNSLGQRPTIPELVFKPVKSDTMIAELESGEVDLLHKCVSADVITAGMQLTASAPVSVSNYPRSGFSFMSFNCERPAVSTPAVRQAIAHCLDKDALVSDYVSNYGLAANGYYGLGQWVYELVSGAQGAPVTEPDEGASALEQAEYEKTVAAWEELTMENIPTYALDLDAARRLLDKDGWTLNRDGKKYDATKDDVRCKKIEGTIVPLELRMIYPEGNAISDSLDATFIGNLAQVGIKLTAEAMPMTELLDVYYRNVERDCDMIYLATNFATVFEPSATFSPDNTGKGSSNRTAINDKKLYDLAVAMRQTEPGDVLSYCQKWVAFQERWAEVLPAIPVYSNVYFDFYDSTLQNYLVSANQTWSQAIVGAYLGDVMEEEMTEGEEEEFLE